MKKKTKAQIAADNWAANNWHLHCESDAKYAAAAYLAGMNAATLNKYTKEEVIEKLILFGEHVSEKCTGSKLSMIGELNEWCKLNLQ